MPLCHFFTEIILCLNLFLILTQDTKEKYVFFAPEKNDDAHARVRINTLQLFPINEFKSVLILNHNEYFFPIFLIKVLECCWEELLVKINEAKDLDLVIEAHNTFLNQVMTRALMDNESRVNKIN